MNRPSSTTGELVAVLAATLRATTQSPAATVDARTITLPDELVPAAVSHRLSLALLNAPEVVSMSQKAKESLESDVVAHMVAAAKLVRHTASLSTSLSEAGIDHLVYKGVALGALLGRPTARGAGDVDLLVTSDQIPALHRILVGLSYRPPKGFASGVEFGARRGWSFFHREATYVGPDGVIDVHWRISPQRHLFPPTHTLLERAVSVDVGGVEVPTLRPSDAFAAAVFHAYFDRYALLRHLVDVAALVHTVTPEDLGGYSWRLRALMAGTLDLLTKELWGETPIGIVESRRSLGRGLGRVNRIWKRYGGQREYLRPTPTLAQLLRKLRDEWVLDWPHETLPRFIGQRLFPL